MGRNKILPPTNYHLLAAQQEPCNNASKKKKKIFLEKEGLQTGPSAQKDMTEKALPKERKFSILTVV